MAEKPDHRKRRGELHVAGDQMPYVWPRGPQIGPVTGKRIWQAFGVFLLLVLIGVIAFIASKTR